MGEDAFQRELAQLLNKYSEENASDTPDFILAEYLRGCLAAFATAVQQRETWYGREKAEKNKWVLSTPPT